MITKDDYYHIHQDIANDLGINMITNIAPFEHQIFIKMTHNPSLSNRSPLKLHLNQILKLKKIKFVRRVKKRFDSMVLTDEHTRNYSKQLYSANNYSANNYTVPTTTVPQLQQLATVATPVPTKQ